MAKTKLYTFYMSLYGTPPWYMFKMALLAVSYMNAVFENVAHEE